MLVVVRIDAGVHLRAPAVGVFIGVHGVCVENSRELDLGLDRAVLVENPLNGILVIGSSKYLLHYELPGTGDNGGFVAKVAVFEQNSSIFLVNANGILDGANITSPGRKLGIEVVNGPLAVAAERKTVCHVARAVLAQVERVLALMWAFGITTV